ncbi:MAG: MFS transporter [Firmicutes bacterium]|nr:MFS transporter [Bacillota bacterium]
MRQRLAAPRLRLAVGWMTLFVVGADLFVVSPLLPTLAHHFTVTPSVAGWMVTAFAVLYAVGAPWWGARADRVGKRPVILWGLIGFSLGNTLTSVAPTFGLFVGSRMLSGFATAAVVPSIYALIGDVAPAQHRGRWLSIVGSGLLMSLWAGAPLGALIARWAGWPVVFLGLSIGTAILVFANWRVWPGGLVIPEIPHVSSTIGTPWRLLLRDVAVTGFWALAVYGFYTYLGTGLQRVDHLSPGLVATVFAAYGIGATVGSLSGGRLADRFGARRLSTVGLFGLGSLLVLIGFLFRSTILLYPVLLFFAWAAYAFFPAFQSLLAERYPR